MIFGFLSLISVSYFLYSLVSYGIRLKSLSDEDKLLKSQIEALKAKEASLSIDIQKLKDPEYLAKYARENYSYSKDGEYIIRIEDDIEETTALENPNHNYYILCGSISFFIIVIIIFTIKKKKK